jgi:ADP-heptose:LPS heptosyltransferase
LVPAANIHLDLVRRAGLSIGNIRNEFSLPNDALAKAKVFFAANDLDPAKPTLFIQPLTSGAHKNWPLENYLTVAHGWRERGMQIIFGGGPADRNLLQPATARQFCVAAGVPLLTSAGLAQLSSLVLGGDTGLVHLAVAQGKRVIMLMHRVTPDSPTPFQKPEWSVSAPASEEIAKIPIDLVNEAVSQALSSPAGNVYG